MIIKKIKFLIGYLLRKLNYRIEKINKFPIDIEDENFKHIYKQTQKYSLLSVERMYSMYNSIKYVVKANIPGDIVECGVWKGGCCMLAAKTLLSLGETKRKIFLYDTFKGMSMPSNKDMKITESESVINKWKKRQKKSYNSWVYAPFEEVKKNMLSTGYPEKNIIFVKGPVEKTLLGKKPKQISILRLDTDFYESTYQELKNLYPKLSKRGVLIIDDYGIWKGAKKATDDYFNEKKLTPFWHRTDTDERVSLKLF